MQFRMRLIPCRPYGPCEERSYRGDKLPFRNAPQDKVPAAESCPPLGRSRSVSAARRERVSVSSAADHHRLRQLPRTPLDRERPGTSAGPLTASYVLACSLTWYRAECCRCMGPNSSDTPPSEYTPPPMAPSANSSSMTRASSPSAPAQCTWRCGGGCPYGTSGMHCRSVPGLWRISSDMTGCCLDTKT